MAHGSDRLPPLVTLSSDFAVQSQGVGAMEAIVFKIAPQAKVIHVMHGIEAFKIASAARALESTNYLPVGHHVCVCDPGVGTRRKAIAIKVKRGDYLIGPDNGLLLPAARLLGGAEQIVELSNPELMNQPVSPIFHGRDIFAPAAAHLANGVRLSDFGDALRLEQLHPAAYQEAEISGKQIHAEVIHVNKFGSVHLNILHPAWDSVGYALGQALELKLPGGSAVRLLVCRTFGDVAVGSALIMKDDFSRVEIALNQGSFAESYPVRVGDQVVLSPAQ